MTVILDQTRERFLVAIAAQVPAERIAEIHFFSPIKQGGVESGVAVVAAAQEPVLISGDVVAPIDDSLPIADEVAPEASEPSEPSDSQPPRLVVYTARYRLVLKGPDRGKWETNVRPEADAPLVTVDAVVRGVQRRSGDTDDLTRLDGDEIRALLEARSGASAPAVSSTATTVS
jgi:hypothetical protein